MINRTVIEQILVENRETAERLSPMQRDFFEAPAAHSTSIAQ